MASNYPGGGRPANEDGDFRADLPSRLGGVGRPAHTEARAEIRDRETYYAELRFAVHCESRSIPAPRAAALDNEGSGAWAHGASAKSVHENDSVPEAHATETGGPGESRDDMITRFDDTWT